jgi:hypothetical protein
MSAARDLDRTITAACSLGRQGYRVFPCKADKSPATPNGFKDAACEHASIELLWRQHPAVLVGVATGAVGGIAVLDIDLAKHAEAQAWWDFHRERLLPARIHRTRSGGLHLIYRHRPGLRCSAGLINRGVDVRADGGYIIWWPGAGLEVLEDGGIQAWPDWLVPIEPSPPSISHRAIAARSHDLRPLLHRAAGILRTVVEAREGERYRVLFWAACRASDMVLAGDLDRADAERMFDLLREAAERTGLPRHEIDRTITSAMRGAA